MPKDFSAFERAINISFNEAELLCQAFTHRSYLNEHRGEVQGHNERLEFLGDAVLELVITHFLYKQFPEKPEGELTAYRAALVNATTCAEVANDIGMNEYLLLSRGEAKDTGRARGVLLANALEALVGAIYIDQGYEAAERFIKERLAPKLDDILKQRLWQDPKSALQEKAQEEEGVTPSYAVLKEEGPDHDKQFTVGVYLREELLAEGIGRSKQEAEAAAAKAALGARGW
ncbi:ribonuclease III [Candidatus Nomurabacteria bacterium]|nr:ribonuclease III [Candidatus Nomurabacteria bacterium]